MTQRKPKSIKNAAPVQPAGKKKRGRRRIRPWVKFAGIGLAAVAVIAVIIIIVSGSPSKAPADSGSNAETLAEAGVSTQETERAETEETQTETYLEPEVVSTITFGSTGDILIHPSVLNAFDMGSYHDFSGAFKYVAPYYSGLDIMVANLEVTLVDPEDGYGYSANPFLSPESVASALKNAGVDICLTANNHTYDSGHYGLINTLDVLEETGLEYTGTRKSEDRSFILTEEAGGIKLGMICYTYETGGGEWYQKSLNYIPVEDEDVNRINTFDYDDLETLYDDAAKQVKAMEDEGCGLKIFYMHWGEEYQDEPNGLQEEIAQRLSDLGVDVIIGGHPHVVQKFDVIKGSGGNETLCLYSMGNELSNQRREFMNEDDYRGYTEDGVVFILTIDKYNTGDVKIRALDILPTWVEREDSFVIIPLDPVLSPDSWPVSDTYAGIESYNRTMGRLGEAYFSFREAHGQEKIAAEQ